MILTDCHEATQSTVTEPGHCQPTQDHHDASIYPLWLGHTAATLHPVTIGLIAKSLGLAENC